MGIITRFKDIMASNVNALLDKCENPEKMIDQTIKNLNKDLKKVKSETASIMAEEARAKRALDDVVTDIAKLQDYAMKAITAGNDNDARVFLTEKAEKENTKLVLEKTYEVAALNATRMKAMHDKLVADVAQLDKRSAELKTKLAAAKAQEKINSMVSSTDGSKSLSAFDRLEDKANAALDKATAMAELNDYNDDEMDALTNKYDQVTTSSVEDELAALKASMKK